MDEQLGERARAGLVSDDAERAIEARPARAHRGAIRFSAAPVASGHRARASSPRLRAWAIVSLHAIPATRERTDPGARPAARRTRCRSPHR